MSGWMRVLIVEDDRFLAQQLGWFLKDECEVVIALSPEEAKERIKEGDIHVVILDLGLPPMPEEPSVGLGLLEELLGKDPLIKVIVMTAHTDQETAKRALSLGAYDFLSKPVQEELLLTLIKRAFFRREMEEKFFEVQDEGLPVPMVVASAQMREVVNQAVSIASLPVTCLIYGETGTGKELIAKLIHEMSPRRRRPMVVVDCASIPASLAESELFGAEKGAYTGADARREGRIAQAEGGTLLLDEVGELPLELQAKLLRFLETHQFTPVGGRTKEANVRVLAATNRDLREEVKRGRFRLDLYHRLCQVEIEVPPLRERPEDIVPTALHFLLSISREFRMRPPELTEEAKKALLSYGFPGNVRELKNMMAKALVLSRGRPIGPRELGLGESPSQEEEEEERWEVPVAVGFDLPRARFSLEEKWIRSALERHGGKMAQAAADLGIPRTTLYDLMRRHRVKVPE